MPTILVEFEVDNIDDAERVMEKNGDMLERITKDAKDHGAKHHAFFTNGQAIVAVDDWDSETGFHEFFDTNQDVQNITEQAGVTSEPKVTVLTTMMVPGTF